MLSHMILHGIQPYNIKDFICGIMELVERKGIVHVKGLNNNPASRENISSANVIVGRI